MILTEIKVTDTEMMTDEIKEIEEDQIQEVPALHTTTAEETKIDEVTEIEIEIGIEEAHIIENTKTTKMKETKDQDLDQTNESEHKHITLFN